MQRSSKEIDSRYHIEIILLVIVTEQFDIWSKGASHQFDGVRGVIVLIGFSFGCIQAKEAGLNTNLGEDGLKIGFKIFITPYKINLKAVLAVIDEFFLKTNIAITAPTDVLIKISKTSDDLMMLVGLVFKHIIDMWRNNRVSA